MKVPLLNLGDQHKPIHSEMMDAIDRVIRSQSFILGQEVLKLEDQIASYCRTQFAIGVSSGTDALLVSLMTLGMGPGDEVITTPYSFFATAGVIARLGAKPVFVDIDPVTYNMDATKIERAVTDKTKAILPVHLYGQCADMMPILDIANRHHLAVVEDAAQAIGAEYVDGRRAGGMGQLGCLSFFPSKNLGCLGDGGMVLTNDPELAERVRLLRVHGAKPKYYHKWIGGNFRLDAIQAAVLNVKLNYLDGWTQKRQTCAERYTMLFKERNLTGKVGLPKAIYRGTDIAHYHIYNQFVIQIPFRDRLQNYLKESGIGTEIYYPVPFHLQECFAYLGGKDGDFPNAEQAAKTTLALPVDPHLTVEQQEYVVEKITAFYEKEGSVTEW